jgi:hypothetical protein
MKPIRRINRLLSLLGVVLSSLSSLYSQQTSQVFVVYGVTYLSGPIGVVDYALTSSTGPICTGLTPFADDLMVVEKGSLLTLTAQYGTSVEVRELSTDPGSAVAIPFQSSDGGFEFSAEVYAYVITPAYIMNIDYDGDGCLSESENIINILTNTSSWYSPDVYLELTADGMTETIEITPDINDVTPVPGINEIPLNIVSYLYENNWWGKDIYFQVRTDYGECQAFALYQTVFNFLKQIPPVQIDAVVRSACSPGQIIIIPDQSIIDNLSDYYFTLAPELDGSGNIFTVESATNLGGGKISLQIPSLIGPEESSFYLVVSYSDFSGGPGDALCSFTTPEKITLPAKPDPLEFLSVTPKHLNCYQDDSGEFTVTVSGGKPPFSISANGFQWFSGLKITGLPAGQQSIRVRDADNCIIQTNATLTQPALLAASVSEIQNPDCFGDPSGRVTLNITGGTGAKEVSTDQSNWIAGNILSGLPAGNYTIYVRDANRCPTSVSVSLSQPPDIEISIIERLDPTCNGFTDGQITVQASGGNGDLQYAWSNGITGPTATSLGTGSFLVTVSDSRGCTKSASFTLSEPTPITFSVSKTMPSCHDSEDGSILVMASGGPGLTGPFDYLWSTGTTAPLLSGIGKGNYVIEATDPAGCKGSETIVLDAPPPPSPNWEENTGIICEGDSLLLDGGDFVSYLWYNSIENLSTSRNFYLKNPGNYFLDVTDAKGCIGTSVFELIVLEEPIEGQVLLADTARVNEIISVIDVTWPVPDSIHWYFSKPVTIHERNSWSAHFSSAEEGLIAVTLRAWYAGCYSDSAKTVMIIDDGKVIEINTRGYERLIRGAYLFPNPNIGYFNVDVKLRERADIDVSVYRASNSIAVYTNRFYGEDQYLIPVSLPGLRSGVYVVIIQAGNEREVLRMVIQ